MTPHPPQYYLELAGDYEEIVRATENDWIYYRGEELAPWDDDWRKFMEHLNKVQVQIVEEIVYTRCLRFEREYSTALNLFGDLYNELNTARLEGALK